MVLKVIRILSILNLLFLLNTAQAQLSESVLRDSIEMISFFNSIESYRESYGIVQNTLTHINDDTSFTFYYQAGIAASGIRDYEDALFWFDRAAKSMPDNLDVKRKQAISLYKSGDLPRAKEIFTAIVVKDSLAASERLWLATLYSQQDMTDSAIQVLRNRPKVHANHFKIMHSEARLLARNKAYYEAIPIYKKLVDRKPEDDALKLEYYRTLFKGNRYNEIIEIHESMFAEFPTHEVAFMIASAFQLYQQEEKALGWYLSAAELAIPTTIDVYYSYAALSAERLGKKALALKMYQKAMEYNPDDGYYAYFSAVLYDELGDKTKAKHMFERFLNSGQMTENKQYAEYAEDKIGEYRRVEFMREGSR